MTYADRTEVSPVQSLSEIEKVLKKNKATKFAFSSDDRQISVAFEMKNRRVRFDIALPELNGNQKTHDQQVKQRYRALLLVIKAKLTSMEQGIETFDEAFLGQIVLQSGQTVKKWLVPQIEQSYASGEMPPMLESGN